MRLHIDSVVVSLDVDAYLAKFERLGVIRDTSRGWIPTLCPYHDDRHPSFAINAHNGSFVCSACGAHGDFVALHAHLAGLESRFDAESDLIATYGRYVPPADEPLVLDWGDVSDDEEETFVDAQATAMMTRINGSFRGLSTETLDRFSVGALNASTAMPWFDAKGRCITIKYRSTSKKSFWYDPPITPGRLRRHLYGYHLVKDAPLIVVCEGEIDAMSVVQSGYAAVALGTSSISASQADLLRRSPCNEIVVFTDNDAAGRKARAQIVERLIDHKRVSVVDWSLVANVDPHVKDANDVLRAGDAGLVQSMIVQRIPVGLPLNFGG